MNTLDRNRFIWVILSALLQGLLLGIFASAKSGALLCMPLTLIVILPFVFWLSQEHWGRRLRILLLYLGIVLMILYLYRLWSLYVPNLTNSTGSFYFVPSQKADLTRATMAVFLLIPFFQCRMASWSWEIPYSEIFFQMCRNLFLLLQSLVVISVFWGLMVTAGLLFDILGLTHIPFIMFNPLVAMPLSSLVIAISISVALRFPGIDSLSRWTLSVLAWLLPPFSILSLIFVICLPFAGLKMLWSTGLASTLMLLLQSGTIILANAAWLDGSKETFTNKFVRFFAELAILLLPIYTLSCLYSIGIRVEQYGLSTDRIQALFLAVVAGIWGIGYAGCVIFRKWGREIGRVNIVCVVIMTAIVIAMNSPLLDPYRLAANNQLSRLETGKISPNDFDYIYTRFNLGRYGNNILDELSKNDSLIIKKGIDYAKSVTPEEYLNFVENNIPPISRRTEIIKSAKIFPEDKKLNDETINWFVKYWEQEDSILRGISGFNELAFIYMDVFIEKENLNELILLIKDGGMVYDVQNNIPKEIGIFSGNFDLKNLNYSDFSVFNSLVRDLSINNSRVQIELIK